MSTSLPLPASPIGPTTSSFAIDILLTLPSILTEALKLQQETPITAIWSKALSNRDPFAIRPPTMHGDPSFHLPHVLKPVFLCNSVTTSKQLLKISWQSQAASASALMPLQATAAILRNEPTIAHPAYHH
jgi:hypothetical protein